MPPSTEPIIAVRGLRHSYGEGAFVREVLHGVDVDLAPGEIAIIMGHSGSGKTTFLTLVSALRAVQTGSVRVAGQEIEYGDHALGWWRGPAGRFCDRHVKNVPACSKYRTICRLDVDGNENTF